MAVNACCECKIPYNIKGFYWLLSLLILGLGQRKKESSVCGNVALEEIQGKKPGQGMNFKRAISPFVSLGQQELEG